MHVLTKGLLAAAILMAPQTIMNCKAVDANTMKAKFEHQIKKKDSLIDVSQGWDVLNYQSDTIPNVEDVFKQGVSTPGDQKCALVQAGNVGDATFTAQRVVPMKKGHQYTIDLIYAQFYDQEGTGYIDFNGDKVVATNDATDKEYKKTIIPTKDMDYTITASFATAYPGNAYFKLGYNQNGGGIIDTTTDFDAPVVSPAPEAGDNKILGTAYEGNTVIVSDAQGKEIGTSKVSEDGTFQIKTTRPLHYKEKLQVIQKDDNSTSPAATVEVVDTVAPDAPVLNKITDEDKQVSGTAEPYSKVDVSFLTGDSTQSYEGTAASDGSFNIPLDHTFHGQTQVIANATDEAGRVSKNTSAKVEFAKNLTVALTRPISSIDTIAYGKTSRTNCDITVYFGSRVFSGKSDEDGNFQVPVDKYAPGTSYTVKAVDPLDSENPASADGKVLPRVPALDTKTSGVQDLQGIADPGAEVTLTLTRGKDSYAFTAVADAQGKFSIPLKDKEGKSLTLAVGDKLSYSAKLSGLTSATGTSTIYTYW